MRAGSGESFRPATEDDARLLEPHLRPADRREAAALHDGSCLEALLDGVAGSDPAITALAGEQPFAIFGVVPMVPGVGRIWMLGTSYIERHPRSCLKHAVAWIGRFAERYPLMWNYSHAQDPRQLAWLRSCGFEIVGRDIPCGPAERPCALFMRSGRK